MTVLVVSTRILASFSEIAQKGLHWSKVQTTSIVPGSIAERLPIKRLIVRNVAVRELHATDTRVLMATVARKAENCVR